MQSYGIRLCRTALAFRRGTPSDVQEVTVGERLRRRGISR